MSDLALEFSAKCMMSVNRDLFQHHRDEVVY